MKITVKKISFASEEYRQEVELRSRILREPLSLKFTQTELAGESTDIHLGAFADNKLTGCLVLTPVDKKIIKMRQVAVDAQAQGHGIGKKLVNHGEALSKEMGFTEINLNARYAVVPFYLSLGYEAYGEIFTEVTLPHRKMRKKIVY